VKKKHKTQSKAKDKAHRTDSLVLSPFMISGRKRILGCPEPLMRPFKSSTTLNQLNVTIINGTLHKANSEK